MNFRLYCIVLLEKIIYDDMSIALATKQIRDKGFTKQEQSRLISLIYGVLRHYYSLDHRINLYLTKRMRTKDKDVECILLSMTYQLLHTNTPQHATVSENVEIARIMRKPWATKVINAIGRKILREASLKEIKLTNEAKYEHPEWMIDMIKIDWPNTWKEILVQNNKAPPFTIRTIKKNIDHDEYKKILEKKNIKFEQCTFSLQGLIIKDKLRAEELPLYHEGGFIVQDEAAQFASELVSTRHKKNILDVCAAPGGKTCALIDSLPELTSLSALDISKNRLDLLKTNLNRLNFSCRIYQFDATDTGIFTDQSFDSIILDAPCSSSGVIRRHPDIKLKKNPDNLKLTLKLQIQLLSNIWRFLSIGGELLYITCSIFKEENDQMIFKFLDLQKNAKLIKFDKDWGFETEFGRQILPGTNNSDGFFYSKLRKT